MIDPLKSARKAGLRYVSDEEPGIRRIKKGKGFTYKDDISHKVSKTNLKRIEELVIPPAWQEVWICRLENGHLQVTGKDAKRRKQYRYHEKWVEVRNETKFHRMQKLSEKLPLLKKRVKKDLALKGLPRDKVVAAIVQVMLITQSRIGNSTYAEENESYGLTTLLNKHAKVKGQKIHLLFRGKSGVEHDISFQDPKLSRIIKGCQELPGQELFAYQDDEGKAHDITSSDVNDYLKEVTGEDFTAKDLRTWGGTCKAIACLVQQCPEKTLKDREWIKRHSGAVKETATYLHNTVAVCKKYYVHPAIFEADKNGKLHNFWKQCRADRGLNREEKLLLKLLGEL